ncbi:hypothetical protein RAK27_09305 [Carnobacterium maltaromaticum]|uniref:Uncharacterized protein n=1 Tax=Carnobacterium maltaromaticum TaxID=2751 RepID=A0AAW9K3R5_CARML|nr:hypothetical protein [Carnobacterium maltaromaticum]MDZ5758849.1 hypothetical protein [Carnobacterium maltaromaticum]
MDRMENKKTELVYFKIKQKLANLIGIIKGIQVKPLVVKRKAVNFSEHYASLFKELLSQVLRQLRALHSMNQGFVLAGDTFTLQERDIFYSCGTWSKENLGYLFKLEEIQFCKNCDGKLTRLYNDGKYNLGQKGNYYKCVKCAKMYSQEAVEKLKRSEIFK